MTTRIDFYKVAFSLASRGASLTPDVPPLKSGGRVPDGIPVEDHHKRPTIPGPTLAGSLRAHVRLASPSFEEELFGARLPEDPAPDEKRDNKVVTSSRIRVLGVVSAATPATLVDDHSTAIDRERGAARPKTLRMTKQIEAGASYVAYLRADDLSADARSAWHTALETWTPLLGNGVSVGQGGIEITSITTGHLYLTTREGLRLFLATSGPDLVEKVLTESTHLTIGDRHTERWEATFRLVGDLHSWDGTVDGNLAHNRKRGDRALLTGRSLKGVFRTRTEYILRSVGMGACREQECGDCLACQVFGWQEARADGRGARASVRPLDAVVSDGHEIERTHNAIERFTGGVAQQRREVEHGEAIAHDDHGLLYSKQVQRGGTVTFTVERLGADDELWATAQALLTLVAWDIHDGFVGVGGGTTRGYGQLEWADGQDDAGLRRQAQDRLRALVSSDAGRREEKTS